MFTDEYLLPGFYLVKQHQRIIVHTLILLISAAILSILGVLIGIIPLVAGFTFSGIPVSELSMEQAMNLLTSDLNVIAGATASFVILVLNTFIWISFYIGGIIHDILEPKDQIRQVLDSAFSSIKLTLRPTMLISFVGIILGLIGLGIGWGIWLLSNIWVLGSLFIFLGVTASVMFFFLSSLTLLISNIEEAGAIKSIKKSIEIVRKGSVDYFLLFLVVGLINIIILSIPIFGVLISLITLPISIAALAGYYHVNKFEQPITKPKQTAPPSKPIQKEEKPSPPPQPEESKPKAVQTQKPKQTKEKEGEETVSEETRARLDKILKDV